MTPSWISNPAGSRGLPQVWDTTGAAGSWAGTTHWVTALVRVKLKYEKSHLSHVVSGA